MKEIKYLWEAETYSVLLYQYQVCVKRILEINNGFEKLIYDDTFIGFIDIDLDDCFIELKTRTTDDVLDIETVLQCEIYKRIVNKPYHIVNINRKTNKVVELIPTPEQIKKVNEFIDQFVKLSKIIEWK